jgi:hypothetical protein
MKPLAAIALSLAVSFTAASAWAQPGRDHGREHGREQGGGRGPSGYEQRGGEDRRWPGGWGESRGGYSYPRDAYSGPRGAYSEPRGGYPGGYQGAYPGVYPPGRGGYAEPRGGYPDQRGYGFAGAPPASRRAPEAYGGDWSRQQDEVRAGVRQGRYVGLATVIGTIRQRSPGRQLDAGLEQMGGRAVYRVRWAEPGGRRIDYIVDAQSGAILHVEGR